MNAPLSHSNTQVAQAENKKLFQPLRIGDIEVANRVVMAPLTRGRADEANGDIPGSAMNVEYYRQRSNAGLIISEGTQVSPIGKGYMATPGIYSDAQVEGWKAITQVVHDAGSKIVAQIWHVGRVTHSDLTGGAQPVAPSAIQPEGIAYTHNGKVELPMPRALSVEEIAQVVEEYRRGAANAIRAGFDGVEIHGANGYLIDQFLRDGANKRTDVYGGSVENRCRFALEVVDAVIAEVGAGRVGIRLSPVTPVNDISDSNPQAVFGYLVEELNKRGIAFIHFIEGATGGARDLPGFDFAWARQTFKGVYIANNGYNRDLAIDVVESGRADAVAFGRLYIANPDLVQRLKSNAPVNAPNPQTFYTPGPVGYVDYPHLQQAA
ncbi:N-ethylmaleimide reductase [Paucimonas lemoignei]|uniref:N-ethylmaleimide reductase n=1 Tax=Paucimonas lemoignei TaxID=29443 RepID=A0A4R3HW65_PAULE|nr:alkene reductase [Paucimonas lemoignei]TCS37517.1 N-ethylmaleimide reductase [Paucimonas lemoignei]